MVWFISMIAGLFGIYANGHRHVNKARAVDPVITALDGVKESISELAHSVSGIDARVTALEGRDNDNGR